MKNRQANKLGSRESGILQYFREIFTLSVNIPTYSLSMTCGIFDYFMFEFIEFLT